MTAVADENTFPAKFDPPVETWDDLKERVRELSPGHLDCDCPEHAQHNNTLRAVWAASALVDFKDRTALNSDEEWDTMVGDLLCNLMHLCDTLGVDFKDTVDRAETTYYLPELHGEP